jgi:hypothetical protein
MKLFPQRESAAPLVIRQVPDFMISINASEKRSIRLDRQHAGAFRAKALSG